MDTVDTKRSDARRQAEDRFTKVIRRDAEVRAYQQQQWDAEAAKIARLRALRMARDAAEPGANATSATRASRARPAKAREDLKGLGLR